LIQYVARRVLHAVPVILGVTLVSFLLIRLIPGDPIAVSLGGTRATTESITYWREFYGLDDPLPVQYVTFLTRVAALDLGQSIQLRQPVSLLIGTRLGPTIALVLYSVVISIVFMFPLALLSAANVNRWPDNLIKYGSMVTFAMPAFWTALLLVQVFSLRAGWFPASGLREGPIGLVWSLTLPATTIALYLSPALIRTLRATMVSLLSADHVEAARARGLPEARVLRRYVLRNSLTATITLIGLNIGFLIGGSIIVENVFALPGIGQLLVNAVAKRDFPVVQACVLLIGIWIVLVNLVVDVVNGYLDPRVRR
jgi:peptide/nickel transport system permease protein